MTERLRTLLQGTAPLDIKQETLENQDIAPPKIKPGEEAEMRGFKTSGFKSSFKPAEMDREPLSGSVLDEGDVDGDPMDMGAGDDDVDGEALNGADSQTSYDLDGEAFGDIDGEELNAETVDDAHGAPIDDDMDGEPL